MEFVKYILSREQFRKVLRGDVVTIPAFFRVGHSSIDLQIARPREMSFQILRQDLDDIENEGEASGEANSGNPV
jgi:hypothetical protein